MRSFVFDMPEEINRRVSDHLSTLLFCPTSTAVANCKREGLGRQVVLSGDLMYELLHRSRSVIRDNQTWLKKWHLEPGQFFLMTTHRAGNVDAPEKLRSLLEMIERLPLTTILPLHPRTAARLRSARLMTRLKKIPHLRLCEPLGYLDMLTAAYHARAVLTDSGGLQKEAVFLRTPVLTLREETEWPETLKRGNQLVGLDASRVMKALDNLSATRATGFRVTGKRPSELIVNAIAKEIARG
jgi:UDP-N-acetylglucosamine 2-epimerase